ncbi:MAG: type 4a pilus biogenesis protein PilO [Acidobacteriota bacterium]
MAIETGFEGKPWYVSALVAVGLAAAIVFGVHYAKISDMKQQYKSKETRLQELQNKINEGRAASANLAQFRDEVQRLELELEKLLRILPSRRNTEDLLSRIRALAEQGNFALRRFTPQGLLQREFYSEYPIKIELDGTYHNLAQFFDRIGRFSRIINVESLNVSQVRRRGSDDGNAFHTVNASFTAKTFIYTDSEDEE